jgi:hypothetical protein
MSPSTVLDLAVRSTTVETAVEMLCEISSGQAQGGALVHQLKTTINNDMKIDLVFVFILLLCNHLSDPSLQDLGQKIKLFELLLHKSTGSSISYLVSERPEFFMAPLKHRIPKKKKVLRNRK